MRKLKLESILRLVAMTLIVVFAWGIARDRLSLRNWNAPLEYDGDGLEFAAWIKAASEGDFIPFLREGSQRLAAPYRAGWEDYPAAEKFYICFLGVVAKSIGVFPACNFGMLLVHILSAISFYACCRILRYDRTWSFVGAILYGLTYYNFFRGLGGLHLACSYTLPFAILSGWLVLSSKRMRLGDRFSWICLVTAFVMGISGPYFLNIYAQLLCFSMLVQFLRDRRKENLKIGAYSLALVVIGFLAINARTLVYQMAHGKNSLALARNYFEAELYALKPIEFIIPPMTHRIQALADLGAKYKTAAWVKGETFSPYLGLLVFAGMVWVFAELLIISINRKGKPRETPPHGFQIAWVIGYSVIGGINCLIALCGFQLFRVTLRYSIFVSLITLLFLVARLTVRGRLWSPGLKYALAAAALVVGIFDQIPRPLPESELFTTQNMLASDHAFALALEEKLPPAAMVFQLPIMVFPEAPPIRNVSCYNMLRPYLHSKTLRFSYGAIRGRTREDWQWDVEKMPAQQMISQLEKYGFAAIYINRRCYADQGEDMLKQFAAAGKTQVIDDALHEQTCVLLSPAAKPELPHTDNRAQLEFKSGWIIRTQTPNDNRLWQSTENRQWSDGEATVSFFSEEKQVTSYTLKCVIGSISARHVSIQMKGREVWSGEIPAGQATPVNITVNGSWGGNKIEFNSDQPPVHSQEGLPLAYTVMNLEITK